MKRGERSNCTKRKYPGREDEEEKRKDKRQKGKEKEKTTECEEKEKNTTQKRRRIGEKRKVKRLNREGAGEERGRGEKDCTEEKPSGREEEGEKDCL